MKLKSKQNKNRLLKNNALSLLNLLLIVNNLQKKKTKLLEDKLIKSEPFEYDPSYKDDLNFSR